MVGNVGIVLPGSGDEPIELIRVSLVLLFT
jgi:hypothetical protein